jgi:TetR/AcrR family transcriptional repressor of mexJK operon
LKAADKTAANQPTPKQQEILKVASGYFLEHGFQGTSVNVMAREAGISKESIYRYFSSKEELFEAVIARELAEYKKKLQFLDVQPDSLGLEAALVWAAESILAVVSSKRTLALRRLIFREAEKSPQIGEYYYGIGPQTAYLYLEKIFRRHREGARLEAAKLARNFVALLLHSEMLKLDCSVASPMSQAQLTAHAVKVSKEFLAIYYNQVG